MYAYLADLIAAHTRGDPVPLLSLCELEPATPQDVRRLCGAVSNNVFHSSKLFFDPARPR